MQVDAIPPEIHATSGATAVSVEKTPPAKADAAPAPTPEPAAPEKPAPQPKEAPAPARRGGFLPLLLGGVLAGAAGFVIGTRTELGTNPALDARIAAQDATIAALERQIADLPETDLSNVETAQAALSDRIETVQAALDDLAARTEALERLPRGDGTTAAPAIAAYEADLDDLRAQIADMTEAATTQLTAARAEAAAIEENAAAAARTAAARAALARIQTALESGAPLGAALADLEDALGESAPDALLAAQDGVPTLASLQEQFPDYARAALTTARREGVAGEETSGFGAFLRNQFEVRSVAPRAGEGSDAILSRAEGALRAGRLSDALAEISALPEVARAEMSDWLAQAEMRADAIAATDILSTSLIDN